MKRSLNITDSDFIVSFDMCLKSRQLKDLENLFNKRLIGIPLAYVLNNQFFWKNDFYVNENVLIPRQDSETLVQSFLNYFSNKNQELNILEIGVGSGCLILSILEEYKNSHGMGIDISKEALDLCKINAKNLDLENRLILEESNLFEKVNNKFDVIISNPPYIDENDTDIAFDVKKFEPEIALFAKNNGLFFYQQILNKAKNYLNKNGIILFEIGYTQNKEVINIALQEGFLHIETIKDLSKRDRVVIFKLES